jgi:hypothetical protein
MKYRSLYMLKRVTTNVICMLNYQMVLNPCDMDMLKSCKFVSR